MQSKRKAHSVGFFSCWSRDKMVANTWELGSAIAADLKIVQSLTGIGKS
jgi:hypothetical protein